MEKNGNTFETGDAVRKAGTEGKVAAESGEVLGCTPDTEEFCVKWADGQKSWHRAEELEPA